ncbi:MAG: type II toxin-antitoxin system Phd/YefM family antitoxin [Spirochaetaceae bacterium]|nr:MAG: type II toxin-antitoxin system Phd/YefM family antitoxin [Spirochaetaceae bacterium]
MKTELVTNLKRHATRILSDLRDSGESVLITEHGKPSAYLVDVESFEFMQNRLRGLDGIVRGERNVLAVFILHVMRSERLLRSFILEQRDLDS